MKVRFACVTSPKALALSARAALLAALLAALPVRSIAQEPAAARAGAQGPPTLVVSVAVDQLRGDLVDRYGDLFTGGLRRLLDEGLRFPNTTHDHARTETAPGHATLSTGSHPSRHGIVGNTFYVRDMAGDLRSVYSVEDPSVQILEHPGLPGRSPLNFQSDGLGDWLLAASPESEVVSISRKDRAAIGMAARARGHVYWIIEGTGRFTTSTHYRTELPEWVARFNRTRMGELYARSVWESTIAPGDRARSRPDTAAFEGDGVHTWFPHRAAEEADLRDAEDYNQWVARTPAGQYAVTELAREAIRELALGQRGVVDLLTLSYSEVDYIGHRYGPLSREQMQNLLELDRTLGDLMEALDREVGPGRWVLGLSADHGVLDVPETRDELHRMGRGDWEARRSAVEVARSMGLQGEALQAAVREGLEGLPSVHSATPYAVLRGSEPVDSITQLQRNGYFEGRHRSSLGLLELETTGAWGWYESSNARGTGHGSPWYYDRWVPLYFVGPGVEAGVRSDRASTTDLAPTLAGLAGIPVGGVVDGRDLLSRR